MKKLALIACLLSTTAHAFDAGDVHQKVVAACGCNIISVRVVDSNNKGSWTIQFADGATTQQIAAANAAMQAFDVSALPGSTKISRMQAFVALSDAGLLTAVQAWIATQDAKTQLIWANAQEFRRDSALLARGAVALSLTQPQVDALFAAASQVSP